MTSFGLFLLIFILYRHGWFVARGLVHSLDARSAVLKILKRADHVQPGDEAREDLLSPPPDK